MGQGTGKVRTARREPTDKMKKAAKLMAENGSKDIPLTKGEIMKQAGYSEVIQVSPTKITSSLTFKELLDHYMPDDNLARVHKRLLETRKIEHMVFPLGPKDEDDLNLSGSKPNSVNQVEKAGAYVERTTLTDEEIKDMLKDVNCTVKRIVHGDTARHVYYWAYDANAQTKALDLAYKMKGFTTQAEAGNTFIFQQGNNTNSFMKK